MNNLINLLLCILLFSCSGRKTDFKSFESFNEYINNVDNGYILSKKVDDFVYEIKVSPPTIESDNSIAIHLRMNREDGTPVMTEDEYSKTDILQIENYLSFGVEKDFKLLAFTSNISPSLVHYERNYLLKPSIDILVHFDGLNINTDYEFEFNDLIFSKEKVVFLINQELLNVCYVEK